MHAFDEKFHVCYIICCCYLLENSYIFPPKKSEKREKVISFWRIKRETKDGKEYKRNN